MQRDQDEELEGIADEWYVRKSAMMVDLLGPEHDMVGHSIIPYHVGGGLDLYYFPNGIPGTAIATKELCELPDRGPSNDAFRAYELLMFTRHRMPPDDAEKAKSHYGRAQDSINAILNCVARYSEMATLNPFETCEFPKDMEDVGGKCLIFDAYKHNGMSSDFGLLVLIEVYRAEMNFARKRGGKELLERLKKAGHYPYSDMDRPSVVSRWGLWW